jgi:hypothetical protein
MPNLVTRYFHHNLTERFFDSVLGDAKYYLYIGKILAWDTESSPNTLIDTVSFTDYEIWNNMISAKKVQASDVSYVIPRFNWTSGNVYRYYDNLDDTLFDVESANSASANTFYVYSSLGRVYKCLDNNYGEQSVNEPSTTDINDLEVTSDGYIWKFMYEISGAELLKYGSPYYLPVKDLSVDDASAQWDIQQGAANGSIDVINVTAAGNNYIMVTGTIVAVSNTTITLAANSSPIDDEYDGSAVFITTGAGAGQLKNISSYDGTTKVIDLSDTLFPVPSPGDGYIVSPRVTIAGDGSGATAYANVTSSNTINYINIVTRGADYSWATATVSDGAGSGATTTVRIPPAGGHGSNARKELGGSNITFSIKATGDVSNTWPTENEFRIWGLLTDPLLSATQAPADSAQYDQTIRLNLSSVTSAGAYTLDEVITGSISGTTANVVKFANTNASSTTGVLHIVNSNTAFNPLEIITAGTSGITAFIESIQPGDLKKFSGDILYSQSIQPITRDPTQSEDFHFIITF